MIAVRVPSHAIFSHSTAALLWNAPLPWHLEGERRIHVAVVEPAARLHSRDIVGHRLELNPEHISIVAGLRVTSPARTWCDLSTQLALGDLVAVGDHFFQHALPMCTIADILRVLDTMTGKRGVRLAREAVGLLDGRAESRPESRLRVIIVTAGLPVPEVNHSLVDSVTGKRVRPDFLFRAYRVILEYQGDYHRTREQWRRDMTRRSRLEAEGWRVVELNADDLKDPEELVRRILMLLKL